MQDVMDLYRLMQLDATQFSIDNGVTFQGVNAFTNLCPGNYDIVVTNAVGCQATSSAILNDPLVLSYSVAINRCFLLRTMYWRN